MLRKEVCTEKITRLTYVACVYEKKLQSLYEFEYWQYSNEGKIPAIEGSRVDMNIQLIKK